MTDVLSPLDGEIVRLEDVADPVFAEKVMGEGVALTPRSTSAVAPVSGKIEKLFEGGHAFVIQTGAGVQVLVHLGIDTVHLKGEGFKVHASEGDEVSAGDAIVTVDIDDLRTKSVDLTTPVVVISGHSVDAVAQGEVAAGARLFRVAD